MRFFTKSWLLSLAIAHSIAICQPSWANMCFDLFSKERIIMKEVNNTIHIRRQGVDFYFLSPFRSNEIKVIMDVVVELNSTVVPKGSRLTALNILKMSSSYDAAIPARIFSDNNGHRMQTQETVIIGREFPDLFKSRKGEAELNREAFRAVVYHEVAHLFLDNLWIVRNNQGKIPEVEAIEVTDYTRALEEVFADFVPELYMAKTDMIAGLVKDRFRNFSAPPMKHVNALFPPIYLLRSPYNITSPFRLYLNRVLLSRVRNGLMSEQAAMDVMISTSLNILHALRTTRTNMGSLDTNVLLAMNKMFFIEKLREELLMRELPAPSVE